MPQATSNARKMTLGDPGTLCVSLEQFFFQTCVFHNFETQVFRNFLTSSKNRHYFPVKSGRLSSLKRRYDTPNTFSSALGEFPATGKLFLEESYFSRSLVGFCVSGATTDLQGRKSTKS